MRIVAVVALALLATTLYAPAAILPALSPNVKVAFDLYEGCMASAVSVADSYVNTAAELEQFTKQSDENCISWMAIWYPVLMGKDVPDITTWKQDEFRIMELYRAVLLREFKSTIRKDFKIK